MINNVINVVFSFFISASFAAQSQQGIVQAVYSVTKSGVIVCKVKELSDLEGVRVKVRLAGICFADDLEAMSRTRSVLSKALESAGEIRVVVHKIRPNFYVDADVIVDGQDLAGQLVGQGLAEALGMDFKQVPIKKLSESSGLVDNLWRSQKQINPSVVSQAAGDRDRGSYERRVPSGFSQLQAQINDSYIDMRVFTETTTLSQALGMISQSADPPLPLVVFWNDLENRCLLDRDSPAGIGGVGRVTLRKAIGLVLAAGLSYGDRPMAMLNDPVITIASRGTLRSNRGRVNEVYHVDELLAVPMTAGAMSASKGHFGSQMNRR